jgi:hypothetical protein
LRDREAECVAALKNIRVIGWFAPAPNIFQITAGEAGTDEIYAWSGKQPDPRVADTRGLPSGPGTLADVQCGAKHYSWRRSFPGPSTEPAARDRSLRRMAACSASLNFRWRCLSASNSFLPQAARMSPLGR